MLSCPQAESRIQNCETLVVQNRNTNDLLGVLGFPTIIGENLNEFLVNLIFSLTSLTFWKQACWESESNVNH